MKRAFLAAFMAVLLALGAAGCGGSGNGSGAGTGPAAADQGGEGRLQVVATVFPCYDFARQTAGDAADVRMLLKPGEEIHSYEPTPSDIRSIQNCDLFIYVGGENDEWVEGILENMGEDAPETFVLTEEVETVEEEIVEGMQEGAGHDHEGAGHAGDSSEAEHAEADEHVWTSPVNAAQLTDRIAARMEALDPANAPAYRANAEAYREEILALDAEIEEIVEGSTGRTLIFGDRFPLRYFADRYGLRYYAAFPGCSAESEVSASTIAFLIGKVREEEIPVVFSIEFSNGNIARSICEATGAEQKMFHSCHNVTAQELEAGETYVSLMRGNLEGLRAALGNGDE